MNFDLTDEQKDQGRPIIREAAEAKLLASDLAVKAASSILLQDMSANHHALDLTGSLPDLIDLGIAEHLYPYAPWVWRASLVTGLPRLARGGKVGSP